MAKTVGIRMLLVRVGDLKRCRIWMMRGKGGGWPAKDGAEGNGGRWSTDRRRGT